VAIFVVALLATCQQSAAAVETLKSYNVKLDQTSVSGISSGAFMAVQFGVAHSAIVRGVGATAGGPYFCAETLLNHDMSTRRLIARCMQGDPASPAIPITAADHRRLIQETEQFAARGDIDPVSNLARQKVWLFHGYNDGLVRKPVVDALYSFYSHFAPTQVFRKDNLRAGHAQVIDYCPTALSNCECAKTGDEYIKSCAYDSAGVLLQHIYGSLEPKVAALQGDFMAFSQDEFARDLTGQNSANAISMGATGYAYVPKSCGAMAPCRVHVALHGCEQYGEKVADRFYRYAGYNEWADANNLIVLYPQTTRSPSWANPGVLNPMGCWDWWGYNHLTDSEGRYATQRGLQIAAIKRMLDRLAGAYSGWQSPAPSGALTVTDFSHRQVALRWGGVANAAGYNLYRARSSAGPYVRRNAGGLVVGDVFVDDLPKPARTYFYVLKSVDSAGRETPASSPVRVSAARRPHRCDPYFSLLGNHAVTRNGERTDRTCP
jgi:poly(3-hydroxybutyrate) depolymerase